LCLWRSRAPLVQLQSQQSASLPITSAITSVSLCLWEFDGSGRASSQSTQEGKAWCKVVVVVVAAANPTPCEQCCVAVVLLVPPHMDTPARPSSTTSVQLHPEHELRLEINHNAVLEVKLVQGDAECFGT